MSSRSFLVVIWVACTLLACPVAGGVLQGGQPMNEAGLEQELRQDIEGLHEFFVGWYNGNLPPAAFETEFVARLAPMFTIIMPSGVELGMDSLSSAMRESFGKNPGFHIEIRNVQLIHSDANTAIASYEEWQRTEQGGLESVSGRVSTVVFSRGTALRWLHVHETWLPDDIVREYKETLGL